MPNFVRGVSDGDMESPQPVFVFQDTGISSVPDIVKNIPGTLYSVQVDASSSLVPVFIQIFDASAGSVSVGSTAADEIIEAQPFVITTVSYLTSASLGKSFVNAITVCGTTTLTGATSPTGSVSVAILYQ